MLNIGEFFKRIKGSFAKEIFVRNAIKEAVKKYTGADIQIEDISFKGSTVMLKNVNQSARSTIFIKKHAIIKEVNTAQNIRIVSDVR
jgi:hypothetical protein